MDLAELYMISETEMSSFWQNFHHWLHWKLSFWQLPVHPVMKISSKSWDVCFSYGLLLPQDPYGIHFCRWPQTHSACKEMILAVIYHVITNVWTYIPQQLWFPNIPGMHCPPGWWGHRIDFPHDPGNCIHYRANSRLVPSQCETQSLIGCAQT